MVLETLDVNAFVRWSGIVILVGLTVGLTIALLWFTIRWKEITKTKKTDPLFKALIFTFCTIAIVGALEMTGLIEPQTTKKFLPIFGLVFVGSLGIYYWVGRARQTLSPEKQITFMKQYLRRFYNTQEIRNYSYNPDLLVFKETFDPLTGSIIGNGLFNLYGADDVQRPYIVKISAYTGKLLFIMPQPTIIEEHRLTGDKLAPQTDYRQNPFDSYVDDRNDIVVQQKDSSAEQSNGSM